MIIIIIREKCRGKERERVNRSTRECVETLMFGFITLKLRSNWQLDARANMFVPSFRGHHRISIQSNETSNGHGT